MAPSTWNLPLPGVACMYLSLLPPPSPRGSSVTLSPEPVLPLNWAWDLKSIRAQGWRNRNVTAGTVPSPSCRHRRCNAWYFTDKQETFGNLMHVWQRTKTSHNSWAPPGNVPRRFKTQRQRLQCSNWFYFSFQPHAPPPLPGPRGPGPWALPRDAQKPGEGGSCCIMREGLSLLFVK